MATYPRWTTKFEIKPGSWVFVPSEKSIENGKEIKSLIENHWNPPSYYYHLKKGGHIKALKKHLKSTSFINLDIKNFYGSINKSRVTRCVKKFFGYEKARFIAKESTVRHPINKDKKFMLPFGFVQSPILASLCLSKSHLGIYINKLHAQSETIVSVYMDDIIISTRGNINLNAILDNIKVVAEKSKFEFNTQKEEGPSEKITAFNINLRHKYLEIEKQRYDKFLAAYLNSSSEYQREGIKSYITSVNPDQTILTY